MSYKRSRMNKPAFAEKAMAGEGRAYLVCDTAG